MADVFLTNQTPATAAVAMFNLKTTLKSAGWTILRSGDGTTFFSASDGITTGASGAGGLDNTNAYYELKWPGSGNKSISVQRTSTNLLWRIKYSFTAGFTAGSASATRVGTATDEAVLLGGGTDASPTGTAICNSVASGGWRHNVWAQSAAPYGFYSLGFTNGGLATGPIHLILLDHMLSTSYQAGDNDPYVFACSGASTAGGTDLSGGANAKTSINAALAGTVRATIFNSLSPISNGGLPPNPITGQDEATTLNWQSTVAPAGNKGWSDIFYYHLTGTAAAPRTTPTAVTYSTTKDRCVFGILNVPWDGSSPTV